MSAGGTRSDAPSRFLAEADRAEAQGREVDERRVELVGDDDLLRRRRRLRLILELDRVLKRDLVGHEMRVAGT